MQEATFILLRHMLQNEPSNVEGLRLVKDLAVQVFGDGIKMGIEQIQQQHAASQMQE